VTRHLADRFLSSHGRPTGRPKAGKERASAGIDTSHQGHEPGQFESKSDPGAHPREIFTVRKLSQKVQIVVRTSTSLPRPATVVDNQGVRVVPVDLSTQPR
jgi:hypothetical protein